MRAALHTALVPLLSLLASSTGARALPAAEIVVADDSTSVPRLVRVDPVSGDRTVFSGCTSGCGSLVGAGPSFASPHGLTFGADGAVFVADPVFEAVFRVDPDTGDRTVLSGCRDALCTSTRGAGVVLGGPQDVSLSQGGELIVGDRRESGPTFWRVFRVDPVTGNRSLLSSQLMGAGVSLNQPDHVAVEFDDRIAVSDPSNGTVVRIDPATGDRAAVSSGVMGTGPPLLDIAGLAAEKNRELVIALNGPGSVYRIDPGSGDRTVLSSAARGAGPALVSPRDLAVEEDLQILAIQSDALLRIEPTTGDRTIVSSASRGTGPSIAGADHVAVAPTPRLPLFDFESEFPGSPPSGFAVVFGNVTVEEAGSFSSATRTSSEAGQLAMLTTGPGPTGAGPSGVDLSGDGSDERDVASMFIVFDRTPADPPEIAFDFDVVTAEVGGFPDVFLIRLDGTPLVSGAVSAPNGTFPAVGGFLLGPIYAPDASAFANGRLGYRTVRALVAPGPHVLEFFVGDALDEQVDSGLLVDDIRLLPEPRAELMLAAGIALLAALRRLRARGRPGPRPAREAGRAPG